MPSVGPVSNTGLAWKLGDPLVRLSQRPEVVTPERVRPDRPDLSPHLVEDNRPWVELWCNGSGHLDPARPLVGHDQLYNETADVLNWVNTRVAHIDSTRPDQSLTFERVHETIDHIGQIYQTYANLLTGTHFVLEPAVQDN